MSPARPRRSGWAHWFSPPRASLLEVIASIPHGLAVSAARQQGSIDVTVSLSDLNQPETIAGSAHPTPMTTTQPETPIGG
jgi:hypothetical protein